MLILDKPRALDRMLYLSDRKGNAVPTEFRLAPSALRWTIDAGGRRALAGEVVLRPTAPALASDPAQRDRGLEAVAS